MFEEYVVLQGSHRTHPANAVVKEQIDPNKRATITLSLRGQVEQAPRGGTISKLRDDDIALVEAWAAKNNFSVDAVHVAAKTIEVSGLLNCLAEAFSANLQLTSTRVSRGVTDTRITRDGSLFVPLELDGIILGVFGFDQRPVAQPHFRLHPRAGGPVSYTPPQVAKAYNFPTNKGVGQTIAIVELGGGYNGSDLLAYWKLIGVPPMLVTAVGVGGAKNQPTGDPNSADGEVCLDIEVIGGLAHKAKIAVYFGGNTDQGFLAAINAAIHDTVRKPSVISISWGGPESSWTPQTMTAFNTAFQDAAAMGITICVASGDNGADDGVGDGKNHVDFPASSPWVLACGGTSLRLTVSGGIQSEVVWNDGAQGGASGGGVSTEFLQPSYQAGIAATATGRGVPDVAGVADPETGWVVIVDGQQTVIGGTSAVAPAWAALIALCNQWLATPAGLVNPVLYGTGGPQTCHDITSGNNGVPGLTAGYQAGVGWDACTGWGSPNGQAVLALLKAHRGAK